MAKYKNKVGGNVRRWPADDWFSKCVRLAADNRCESCGQEATDNAHIYGRRHFTVRWSKLNCVALCRRCHSSFTDEPCMWADFVDAKWPGRRELIQIKMQGIGKNSPEVRKMVCTHYNKEFRRMEKTGDRDFETWN